MTKNPTRIGDGAFVGSNATLVAPVEIGAGSYIAAGSVITKDVPPDSLALAREHQVVKEDWAKHRREKRDIDGGRDSSRAGLQPGTPEQRG
jgi:bifunctional UDP-N-acetylglucosamine pyrophosphorylase/glucosamine-1-phosphate N-acetyltransferase